MPPPARRGADVRKVTVMQHYSKSHVVYAAGMACRGDALINSAYPSLHGLAAHTVRPQRMEWKGWGNDPSALHHAPLPAGLLDLMPGTWNRSELAW